MRLKGNLKLNNIVMFNLTILSYLVHSFNPFQSINF